MNGVMKTQSEYYNDSTNYTGVSGSINNKFVIEDIYDLLSTRNNDSLYFELACDIDFNEHPTYKFGVSENIFGKNKQNSSSHLYGNNHTIRNLVIKDSSSIVFSAIYVENLILENLIFINSTNAVLFRNTSGNSGISSECKATNIHIGCYMFNSATSCIFNPDVKHTSWTDCSFNIKGLTTDGLNITQGSATNILRCHINVDIKTMSDMCIYISNVQTYLDNVYITGSIKQIGTACMFDDGTNNFMTNGCLENSYIAVNAICETDGFTGYRIAGVTSTTVSFIDKELVQNLIETEIQNLHYLTTDECKDPEYLLSINFPVVYSDLNNGDINGMDYN